MVSKKAELKMASGKIMNSIEIFSGCGGLAYGLAEAGFSHRLLLELNGCAVETVRFNKALGIKHVVNWPIQAGDVSQTDFDRFAGVDLLAGGPPCQPFSIGGKASGASDLRDMWPQAIRAVAQARPKAFLFENVRGLARPKFSKYLAFIRESLERPSSNLNYRVQIQLVNAADYGAAQKRQRLLIFGVQTDAQIPEKIICPSHSRERLLWEQWVTGEYWDHHGIKRCLDDFPKGDAATVRRLRSTEVKPGGHRWVTVRDRLAGLGSPNGKNDHRFQDGAKVYPGHTGSPLDQPAKALKAGDHGVPGGENMMVQDDQSVRYFTLRECARLQGLPDDYRFPRSWSESMRQLGNAVPVELAKVAGDRLLLLLSEKVGTLRKAA